MKFKKLLKYLFFLLFISCLAFLYGFSTKKNQTRKLEAPTVNYVESKHQFLTQNMVNKLLIQKYDSLQNQAKSVIDLYSLENQVSANPYVEEATVFLTIGGALKSIIKQRDPIARIVSDKNSYYVDKHGVSVPLSDHYSARVLLVSGIKNQQDVKELLPLLNAINGDDFLRKEIIGVQKMRNNDLQFAVRSGTYKIDFGKLSEIDIKFKKLKAFYNKTFDDHSIDTYKMINLKYHNQVVCTK